jgi:hypothetical protein
MPSPTHSWSWAGPLPLSPGYCRGLELLHLPRAPSPDRSEPLQGHQGADQAAISEEEAAHPSEDEARAILGALEGDTMAAAAVMIYRGLRVGALPS